MIFIFICFGLKRGLSKLFTMEKSHPTSENQQSSMSEV
jgi:hypothetical protein